MRKLNNKGFTLVELLAVVVILVIIMTVALPNISSSIERSQNKQDAAMEKVIISAGELYVSKHKASIKNKISSVGNCFIFIEDLTSEGYLSSEDVSDYIGNCLSYDGANLTYMDIECDNTKKCVSG